jgi:hypothetical protein
MTIMKTKYVLCAMLACLASAVALGQTVSVNYNKSQDFSGYHTYIWASNNANQIQNSILAQQAKSNIDSALQAKGLQLVGEAQNPDLIILASGGLQQQTSYQAWGMRGIGGGMGGITPEQNVVGTLIVDVYGSKDKNLLWRGLAQNTLSSNGNKNSQMVTKAVQKMFKQYP